MKHMLSSMLPAPVIIIAALILTRVSFSFAGKEIDILFDRNEKRSTYDNEQVVDESTASFKSNYMYLRNKCPDTCLCMEIGTKKITMDCMWLTINGVLQPIMSDLAKRIATLNLNNNGISIIRGNGFKNFTKLVNLSMNGNKFNKDTLNNETFFGLHRLERLSLNSNPAPSLSDNIFATLGPFLTYLSMSNFGWKMINQKAFTNLTNLVELDLSKNKFDTLPAKSFIQLPALQILHLYDSRMLTIHPDAFQGLNQLQYLNFSYQLRLTLPDHLFTSLPSLMRLDIKTVGANYINPKAFINVSHDLKDIDFGYNGFRSFPEKLSENLWMLKTLLFRRNRLGVSQISSSMFSGLQSLQKLDLGQNFITDFPNNVFTHLQSLNYLDLNNNYLGNINFYSSERFISKIFQHSLKLNDTNFNASTGAFSTDNLTALSALLELHIGSNIIKHVNWKDVTALTSLIKLDLSQNLIKILPNITLTSLKSLHTMETASKLEYLNLCQNYIYELSSGCFAIFPCLQELYLSSNQIIHIDSLAFYGLFKLKILELSGNPIQVLSDGTFSNLPLTGLYLWNTGLDSINVNAFVNLTFLTDLDLSYNQFRFLPQFLDHENNSVVPNLINLDLIKNPINYTTAVYYRSYPKLQNLTLDVAGIQYIINNSFYSFADLQRLSLQATEPTFIDKFAFRSESLMQLKLTAMLLPHHTIDYFDGMPNLASLDLSKSRFIIEELASLNLPKLVTLNIFGTRAILTKNTFRYTKALRHLFLSRDNTTLKYQYIDGKLFTHLKHLKSLHLCKSGIATINFTSLPAKIWTTLKFIDLSYNPFVCDCGISWFRQWLKSPNMTVKFIDDPLAYACDSPDEMKNFPIRKLTRLFDLHCFTDSDYSLLYHELLSLFIFNVSTMVVASLHKLRWHIQYAMFLFRRWLREHQRLYDDCNYTYDAFVIYSQHDRTWVVHTLRPSLETAEDDSIHLCIHERDFEVGRDIAENVSDSVEASRNCLFIVSNAFAASEWCQFEVAMAQAKFVFGNRNNTILVLLEEIAESNLTARLRFEMQRQTYIEWTDNAIGQQLFWVRLKQALKRPQPRPGATHI